MTKSILAAILALLCITARGQNTNIPPTPTGLPGFFGTVQQYFTSFNTNLDSTFGTEKADLWVGVDSIQGGQANLANSLGLSYNVWKAISLESVTRSTGIAGTFLDQQFGMGLNFVIHDVKLTAYGHAGYELAAPAGTKTKDKLFGELGLRLSKALTTHTFAGVGIGATLPDNRQVFSAFAGVTF